MRADGKRLKNLDPLFEIVPYIMEKRYDSQNLIKWDVDAKPIQEYLLKCRKQGIKMNHMSVIIAAYLRAVSQDPKLNRFVVNKKIYARNHFCVSFVVLKKNEDTGKTEETVAKIPFELDEDILSVGEKVVDAIEINRKIETNNSMDRLLHSIMRIPMLASGIVSILKFADKHGLLPRKIIDASPFHTSIFITNMASIGSNYIYHHLYDFGTTTVFFSIGQPERVYKGLKGKTVFPLGITTDERICSGQEYVNAFKQFLKYVAKPEELEIKPYSVIREE